MWLLKDSHQPKGFFFAPVDKLIKEQLYEWPLVVRTPRMQFTTCSSWAGEPFKPHRKRSRSTGIIASASSPPIIRFLISISCSILSSYHTNSNWERGGRKNSLAIESSLKSIISCGPFSRGFLCPRHCDCLCLCCCLQSVCWFCFVFVLNLG